MRRDEELDEVIDDLKYIITWSIDIDENRNVTRAEIFNAMDMEKVAANEWPVFVEVSPSTEYIQRAKERFSELDWGQFEAGTTDIGASSYLYKSDPNTPECSNDQRR